MLNGVLLCTAAQGQGMRRCVLSSYSFLFYSIVSYNHNMNDNMLLTHHAMSCRCHINSM
jgi:hypothetical protein